MTKARQTRKEQLVYKINRKTYLLVEVFFTSDSSAFEKMKKIDDIGGIEQGVKEIKSGLFDGYVILRYLIPTSKLEEFRKL